MEIDVHEFDPRVVLHEVAGMLEPMAVQRGNTLTVMADPSLQFANTDSTKLRQCLLNLGSNACKFTENGQVFIMARVEGDNLVFSVSDTGIGMEPAELDRLFQPFVQADATTTRRYGGTGLGLTITWRFAELLGGHVEVDSSPGAGSTFTLTIRRDVRSAEALPDGPALDLIAADRGDGAQPLALIIEDEPSAVQLLSRLAARAGYAAISAADGESGLEMARRHLPDIIMLDLGLPRLDGWQVLDAIDADAALRHIPTVVVTVDDDSRRSIAAGAADHLIKPIDHAEMNDILLQYAKKHSGCILIVDDDPATASLYERGFQQMGYQTRLAASGSAARTALEADAFSFVITDLRMPHGNGFDLVDHIAHMPEAVRPRVIVVTGKVLNQAETDQLEGKVVRLLPKNGLSPRKLAGNVREIIARDDIASGSTKGFAA